MVNWKQSLGQTAWIIDTNSYSPVYWPLSTIISPVKGFVTFHDVSLGKPSVVRSTWTVMGISLSSQMIDGVDDRVDDGSTNKEGAIDASLEGAVDGLDDREDNSSDDGVDGSVVIDGTDDGSNVIEGNIELEGVIDGKSVAVDVIEGDVELEGDN